MVCVKIRVGIMIRAINMSRVRYEMARPNTSEKATRNSRNNSPRSLVKPGREGGVPSSLASRFFVLGAFSFALAFLVA